MHFFFIIRHFKNYIYFSKNYKISKQMAGIIPLQIVLDDIDFILVDLFHDCGMEIEERKVQEHIWEVDQRPIF